MAVIVVSGLPRSGTSLMMQMLAAGGVTILTDGVRAPDENNPRGYFEYEPVKQTKRNAFWVSLAEGKAVKVIYALLRDLPAGYEYRVIMMHRHLRETIASQREMLRHLGQAGAGVDDKELCELFEREISEISEWLRARLNFAVLDVEYRECLTHPSGVASRIEHFLGVPLDVHAMTASVDPILYRTRR